MTAHATHHEATLNALAAAVHHRDDRGAFEQLAQRVRPRLLALLQTRLQNHADAQDVTQQALLKAWQNRHAYDPQRPVLPWLFTLTLRLAIDQQRAAGRRQQHEQHAAQHQPTHHQPPDALEQSEHQQRVWDRVHQTLGPNSDAATALWLFYAQGFSAAEIAQTLHKKPATVRVLLHRGRDALRQPLQPFAPPTPPTPRTADPPQPQIANPKPSPSPAPAGAHP